MLAALFLSLPVQSPEFGTDPALDRPLAIETKIDPLPELVARIGREIGVALTVERRLADLKATVLTPALPARRTLAGLASIFEADWIPIRGGGYRLEESIVARNRRLTYLDQEAEARDRLLTWYISSSRGAERLWQDAMLRFLRSDESGRRRFLDGATCTVTVTIEGVPRVAFFRKGERDESVSGHLDGSGGTTWGLGCEYSPELRETPFRIAQREWAVDATGLPSVDRPGLGDSILPPPADAPDWRPPATTVADVARELYARSGLPVIAEANRRIDFLRFPSATKPGDLVRVGDGRGDAIRLERSALLVRPAVFWQRRATEPPEAALRAIEGEAFPSVDEVADVVARLPRPTANALGQCVLRHDLTRYLGTLSGLRLWGALGPRERAALLAGTPVRAASASRLVPAMLAEAVSAAPFDGGIELLVVDREGDTRTWTERRTALLLALLPGLSLDRLTIRFEGDPVVLLRRSPKPPPSTNWGSPPSLFWLRITDPDGNGLRLRVDV